MPASIPRQLRQPTRFDITPPTSPSPNNDDAALLPIIPTDELGMITTDDELKNGASKLGAPSAARRRRPKKHVRDSRQKSKHSTTTASAACVIATPPATPQESRIVAGVNVDDLSSDSSLTDVPDDIGPDPFTCERDTPRCSAGSKLSVKVKRPTISPYFAHKARPHFLSCLPFPPLSAAKFGLMQERLAKDPFRLLIATIFLNRTRGEQAMPVFFQLMEKYPTLPDLAAADVEDVVKIIHRLGFQNQRARKCVEMAKAWTQNNPAKGKRFRKLNYPVKGDGRDVSADETVEDGDARVAWEISYLPGLGPYSHDSWRIFCRDKLRGLSESWNGEGASDDFEPEWKRVLPTDKELRAYLTWMWLKEGWVWNKETGEKTKAEEALLEKARGGGIVQEHKEKDYLELTSKSDLDSARPAYIERPAGVFLP